MYYFLYCAYLQSKTLYQLDKMKTVVDENQIILRILIYYKIPMKNQYILFCLIINKHTLLYLKLCTWKYYPHM